MIPVHYAVKIAYLGKYFHGSQRQPEVQTVEGEMIRVLEGIGAIGGPDMADFRSAGRTDKGVSALGNLVSFHSEMPAQSLFPALSANLKHVFPISYAEVGPDFNPRRAVERWYRYHLQDTGQDFEIMKQAASLFKGYNDFSRFAKVEADRNPMRRVNDVSISKQRDGFFVFDVRGESFLWNMVRRMVMAISMAGSGECSAGDIKSALAYDSKEAGGVVFPPLPPDGLILMDVVYKEKFTPITLNIRRERIEGELRELALEQRVVSTILENL